MMNHTTVGDTVCSSVLAITIVLAIEVDPSALVLVDLFHPT